MKRNQPKIKVIDANTVEIYDDPEMSPRREFALTEKEFPQLVDAMKALNKANNDKFDGTTETNDQIMMGSAYAYAKRIHARDPEILKPKQEDEVMRVIAVNVRPNVEVYWYYMTLGDTVDKVQLADSKSFDIYEAFEPPSWA
jgi:hypothetical protein